VELEQPGGLAAVHERRQAAGADPWWAETWHFDLATPDAALGAFVRLVLLPNRRTCWYWAWVVGDGRRPVMVADLAVPLPSGRSLELRTEGLWADHTVEVPFDHVTLGCEAFALRLDDPRDALAPDPLGERVPFGLDLEWDTAGPVQALPGTGGAGYTIACTAHGEILLADERLAIDDAPATRHHTWGLPTRPLDGSPATTFTGVDDPGPDVEVERVADAPLRIPTPTGSVTLTRTLIRSRDRRNSAVTTAWSEHPEHTHP